MELVYLWVEEYKNIKRQGFNFSPNYTVEFKPIYENEELLESSELIVKKKDDLLDDFFGKDINITVIIGENGSGKSSILEVLYEKYFDDEETKFFLIYQKKVNSENIVFYYCQYNLVEKISNDINLNNSIRLNELHSSFDNQIDILSLYYSNNLTELGTNLFSRQVYNNIVSCDGISISHELNNTTLLEEGYLKDSLISKSGFRIIYNTYLVNQIIKSIKLIQDTKMQLNFFPKKLYIRSIHSNDNINKLVSFCGEDYRKMIINKFTNRGISSKKTIVIRNIVLNILYEISINSNLFWQIKRDGNFMKLINTFNDSLKDFLKELDELREKSRDYSDSSYSFFYKIKKYGNFFETSFSLDDFDNNLNKIDINLLKNYQGLTSVIDKFLSFSWPNNLSGGEESLLYQFARIYDKCNQSNKKNLVLLIDEGENTLHPQWQKGYIKDYLSFLNLLKTKYEKITLILTSHSPFLLSDLPKQNVIFLEKDKKTGQCINTTNDVDVNPFGANIHTLLSHGFFMKDGLIGEFAKNKIDKAIEYLNLKVLTREEIAYCENIISIIGEPIIKRQLQKMLDSKRLSEIEVIKKQIEELQKELATKENKK